MSRFWSERVHQLQPYVPGEQPRLQRLVKLNTNENPYGPSPAVLEAIRQHCGDNLRLYPDPESVALRQTIARYYQVQSDQVFVGNGSDEVLAHIFMALLKQSKPVCFPDITYSFYPVYCQLYNVDYQRIPLDKSLAIDLSQYPTDNGGIIFPNPNAPTGCLLSLNDIEQLLQRDTDSLVVIDEAYIDFGGETAITLIEKYDNLLVTQTLSKSRSLAGMRVGFAVGQAPLIEGLQRVKNSFNSYPLDQLASVAAIAAFEDEDWFQQCRGRVIEQRNTLMQALTDLGFVSLPSAANFLFVRHEKLAGKVLAEKLRSHGVIVRHFQQPERIASWLRITIGAEEQNQALLDALREEIL